MKFDLNCDIGEGEGLDRTRRLMVMVSSVNLACGGHAGTAQIMEQCVALAKQCRVRVGAHPGPWSRGDKGRGAVQITPADLDLLLLQQVGALAWICHRERVPLHHIKLHGALYHLTEQNVALGDQYLRTAQRWWPEAVLYVRAGGTLARRAHRLGVTVWEEAFADRAYQADGSLVPRGAPGALLTDLEVVKERTETMLLRHTVRTVEGIDVPIRPQTLCIHSDTPNAVRLAHTISMLLDHR